MCEFTAATQSPRVEKQWHQHNESPPWSIQLVPQTPLQRPWLSCLSSTRGWSPVSFASYSVPQHLPLASFLRKKKTPPPAFPLEFAGSLAQHGNDIIKRKKWTVWKREIQSEGENTVNTVKCSVIVMYASQRPPSTPPPETGQPSPPSFPQLPACCRPELWGGDVIGCNVSYTESD